MNAAKKTKIAGSPRNFLFGRVNMVVHVSGEEADNQLSLIEAAVPPGGDSGLHVRVDEDESIYLIEGELDLTVGSLQTRLCPGESFFVPRNVPHRVRNIGPKEARSLSIFTPGICAEQYGPLMLVPPYQEGEVVFAGKPPIYKRPVYKREQDTYMFFGVPTVLHLAGIETGNECSLLESVMGTGGDSGLHAHANEDECIYILSGELELKVADSTLVMRAGTAYYIPRNTPHRLRNRERKEARVMHWYTPGTLDPFVRLAGIRIKGPNEVGPVYPSPEQIGPILRLSEEYDFYMLVPPGV